MRDETLPDTRYEEGAYIQKKRKPFNKDKSVWAEFKEDDEAMMKACFEYDKLHWKISRLTKSENELKLTYELLLENYQWIKDTF